MNEQETEITCAKCAEWFLPSRPTMRYCSVLCAHRAERTRYRASLWRRRREKVLAYQSERRGRRRQQRPTSCQGCGSPIEQQRRGPPRKYCASCRRAGKHWSSRQVKCEQCGGPVSHKSRSHYCLRCYQQQHGRIPRLCTHCGLRFDPKRTGRITCSPECATARRGGRRLVNTWRSCEGCGQRFIRNKAITPKKGRDALRYCSRSCAFAHWRMSHPHIWRSPELVEAARALREVRRWLTERRSA